MFRFIKEYNHRFGVERMCKVLKVSRSGFYNWSNRRPSMRKLENEKVSAYIRTIHSNSRGRYGSPKITEELRDLGWRISRPRVARIMRNQGIRSIICRKFRGTTTQSRHNYPVAKNLLNRDFQANLPGHKWVSDITYIPTGQGWMYLTIIMDLYDRKIIGWSLSRSMACHDTIWPAWRMALINRPITNQLIFHSDRGVQYTTYSFSDHLKSKGIQQSMSRKGNCWDNAVAENFFKILKSELVKHTNFYSILQAKNDLFEFIEIWYNRKRKHSYLGYKTPEQFNNHNYSKCA
ncbi:IS3 family transposase [Fulvivirga maritima]|uniref:IS3 family transposase n=1 Tax=Fulvivirga maritima TaxID=2904247 RepID=UPI002795E518|nr:IS3 family transposase [Fulvivirga maritima]